MTDPTDLEHILKRVFPEGCLNRIPKNPEHRNIILAILSIPLMRRYPYSEPELNELLNKSLRGMNARVDHVTARRYLVDLGFLKRDAAGSRYYLNYLKQQEVLPETFFKTAQALLTQSISNAPRARHRGQI